MDTIPELGRPQPKNLFIHLRTTSWSWSEEQRLRVLFIGLSRLCRYTGWHLCITLYVRVHILDARRTESLSDSISPNSVCVCLLGQLNHRGSTSEKPDPKKIVLTVFRNFWRKFIPKFGCCNSKQRSCGLPQFWTVAHAGYLDHWTSVSVPFLMAESCFQCILVLHWSCSLVGQGTLFIKIWFCNEQVNIANILEEKLCDKTGKTLSQPAPSSSVLLEALIFPFSDVEQDIVT